MTIKIILTTLFLLYILMIGAVSATSDTNITISDICDAHITHSNNNAIDKTNNNNNDAKLSENKNLKIYDTNNTNDIVKSENTDKLQPTTKTKNQKDIFKLTETTSSFTDLNNNILNSNNNVTLNGDYEFKDTDFKLSKGIIINKTFTIYGNGHTINANNSARIFNVTTNGSLTLINLTIVNGNNEFAGAIYNRGDLTIINSTLTNNTATAESGAIYNLGNLTITNSNLIKNQANTAGGAIFHYQGHLNITNTTLKNNTANTGGAIYQYQGHLNITNTTLKNNTANTGGAIFNYQGHLNITNTTLTDNIAKDTGGAIQNQCNLTITNTTLKNNQATEFGGAIINFNKLTITNTTLKNNQATEFGGAIQNQGDLNITNTTLKNNTANTGGAIYQYQGHLKITNTTLKNNQATEFGGAICTTNGDINTNNSKFINNYANRGSSIFSRDGILNINNINITSKVFNKFSQTYIINSEITINNSLFFNISSYYAPGLLIINGSAVLTNSKFINTTANITAGAISFKNCEKVFIENCEFINTSSVKNAGAIYVNIYDTNSDYLGLTLENYGLTSKIDSNVTIINSLFKNSHSNFGGAYMQLGGSLIINNTHFINNTSFFDGGATYISNTNATIDNCNFESNNANYDEYSHGGALYSNDNNLTITNSRFTDNHGNTGNALYSYNSNYHIENSIFNNSTYEIYTDFDCGIWNELINNSCNNYSISTNNSFYKTIITGKGRELSLITNITNVTNLPKYFNSKDYGWVSPVKDQGIMGACWTFASIDALESALLKYCGLEMDLSENNMQNTMIHYSIYGEYDRYEGGLSIMGSSYLLSWLGAILEERDSYDELGKISPIINTNENIHIQDIVFINNSGTPENSQLKLALIKYGILSIYYYTKSKYEENSYYNPETFAQYCNKTLNATHAVTLVGWDDNFSKDNFLNTPPGDGAWIIKNSWGTEWGDNGYGYISYYDKTLLKYESEKFHDSAFAIIIENTLPYNKNYQYDILWDGDIYEIENISYKNEYYALDNDLIAAVGTYFKDANENYTVEIYVNDELKLIQKGISHYYGFHTIKLNEYIPIKTGDKFSAVINTNSMPITNRSNTNLFYKKGSSFKCVNGIWTDLYNEDQIACLKIYTLDDKSQLQGTDIIMGYNDGTYFKVNVTGWDGKKVGANETVYFNINGKNITTKTDANGLAKIQITELPGTYIITTKYLKNIIKNNIIVNKKPTPQPNPINPTVSPTKTVYKVKIYLTLKKVKKVSKNIKKLYLKVTVKRNGKKITNKKVTLKVKQKKAKPKKSKTTGKNKKLRKVQGFKFTVKIHGKTYTKKTNKKGKATYTITNIYQKGTYTAKITYQSKTYTKKSAKIKFKIKK